jgi:hypothetical protein
MNRSARVVGGGAIRASAAVLAMAAMALTGERDARACGGCFHPPTQVATDITDERMLLSVSPAQTTLFDQIQYAGSPSQFAWVLPIHGTVTVGLSADVLFDSVDVLTATQITQPPSSCPPAPCRGVLTSAAGAAAAPQSADAAAEANAVTVIKQQNVGPYATVQLHATDSTALSNWLAQNGFAIPADVTPVIAAYVTEGFDFLAMKLQPGQGVQAMRPVRVTTPGASLSLPLRMAAVGTGTIVGITVWIVADGRYEPQNFPFFHIDDASLVWDWSTSLSNYTTLRVENEATLKNGGWEIESSLTLSQQLITNVILSGGQYYGGGGRGFGVSAPSDPSVDYLPIVGSDAGPDSGASETAEEVRTDDVNALFAGVTAPNARVTRIRGDIAHAAMTSDLLLQASADQSELSNVRTVTQSVNELCPVYNGCNVVGTAPAASSSSGATGGVTGVSGASTTGTSSEPVDASISGSTGTGGTSTPGSASGVSSSGAAGSFTATGSSGTTAGSASTGTSSTGTGVMNAGTPPAIAAPASHGGCSSSPQSTAGMSGGAGSLAAVLGLAFARIFRARRRSSRSSRKA